MASPEQVAEEGDADLYGLLNVSSSASNEDIQRAYKALSRTFHPDRLAGRSRHDAATAELAQEVFVRIKTAHDILCDPVYRFVYDQYGHEGVQFLRHCQQQKEGLRKQAASASANSNKSKQKQQQHNNLQQSLDIHLYEKLKEVLLGRNTNSSAPAIRAGTHLNSIAVYMLKDAIERFRRQREQLQQRIRDSAVSFDATLEFPCAYHPHGAAVAHEVEDAGNRHPFKWNVTPYLELEQAHMDFTLRTSNRNNNNNNNGSNNNNDNKQQQQQKANKHIYNTTVGTSTEWEANGKANAEVSLGFDYQESPTSKTQWSCEVRAPISKIPKQQQQGGSNNSTMRPVKLSASTTHEFVSGTIANVGIRGSSVSRDSWEYFITSFRKLTLGTSGGGGGTMGRNVLQPNLRASCATGIRILSQKPLYAFVALNSIPPSPEQQQQQQQDSTDTVLSSLVHLSTPDIQVRAGYHPSPLHASISYEEFVWPWMSLFASWSWSLAHECSKIKLLLSTDLWGFWTENDTTTLRTGLRHDLVSGWIWLLEWEELDWQLKIPISLAITKNNPWLAPLATAASGGTATLAYQADVLHYSILAVLASYVSTKVARSILSDWQGEYTHDGRRGQWQQQSSGEREHHNRSSDATRSDNDGTQDDASDHDEQDGDASAESKRQRDTFLSYIGPVAQKKRDLERRKNGLVLRFAKVMNAQKTMAAWNEGDLESFSLNSQTLVDHEITEMLQFWVANGKLDLPPLSSQTAPYYYTIGGSENNTSSWSFSYLSNELKQKVQQWMDLFKQSTRGPKVNAHHQTKHTLVIRYEYDDYVYEISMGSDDRITLPHPNALSMGKAGLVE